MERAIGIPPGLGGGDEVAHDAGPAQQAVQQRADRAVTFDDGDGRKGDPVELGHRAGSAAGKRWRLQDAGCWMPDARRFSARRALRTPHFFRFRTPHSALRIPHFFRLRTPHSALRTPHSGEGQRGDAGAAFFVGAQVGQDVSGSFRVLGQHKLQVVAQGVFDCSHVLVRHANLVGQRAKDML
jgi:hypothetical protein